MRKNKIKVGVWIAAVGLISSSLGKDTSGLSGFSGKYKGTVTQSGPGDGDTVVGNAVVKFKVPRTGTSAVINYTAAVSDGMNTSLLSTSMVLTAKKKAAVSDMLVGIAGANNAKAGTGRWSQRARKIRIDASNGEGISFRCTAVVRDLRNKRRMKLVLVSDDSVDTTTFTSVVRSKRPRR